MSTINLRRITYMVILLITILLWSAVLWARTTAPGATTAPGHSQVGKVGSLHPGGTFSSSFFFEHNAYSQDETELKLIPRSRQTTRMYMYGQIIFGIPCWVNQSFNIIYIIELQHAVDYLVELYTIYPHYNTITSHSKVGKLSETGSESCIWIVYSACCVRVFARK